MTFRTRTATAKNVIVNEETITVELTDGRTVSAPLAWYPRLFHATAAERNNWRLIGEGEGIHWHDVDEDISVEGLVLGKPSGESQQSLKQWLEQHAAQTKKKESAGSFSQQRSASRSSSRDFSRLMQ
jgi:hypothetical protein